MSSDGMTEPDEVEFDFRHNGGSPWHPEERGDDFDPKCGVALRIGETWIPGQNPSGDVAYFFDESEVSFLKRTLGVLKRLYAGETAITMHAGNQGFLHFEAVGDDHVRVSNHYSEEAIDDESERLGIENTGTCSLDTLAAATLDRVRVILPYGREAFLTNGRAHQFRMLEENFQQVEWEAETERFW
ncbi:hypothetical protein ACFQJC_17820 [Haloferax namakaokahaiae]|uniref:Uncharacterized protein n=1 Tax=Haloferax namakaokahaiae TaxID=1748331 RepID=A0ABD5ZJR5_9EURY